MTFPLPILNYLQTFAVQNRYLAYVLVSQQGLISQWGGNLENYGINNLQEGDLFTEKVFFLEGMLPTDSSSIFLPCIQTEYGLPADIHIFSNDLGTWILFLDASQEESQHLLVQQVNNDLSLASQQQVKKLKHIVDRRTHYSSYEIVEYQNITILSASIHNYLIDIASYSSEAIFSTLNLYLFTITELIVEHGGLVNNIFGDTAIALFGILPPTSSTPNQAIEAALSMIHATRKLQEVHPNSLPLLSIGVGIASGSVIIGTSSHQTNQKSILGYPINLAINLKSQARSGEILIDEKTFCEINNLQNYFSLFSVVNDINEPFKIYSCLLHND